MNSERDNSRKLASKLQSLRKSIQPDGSEALYRLILENIHDAVVLTDELGFFTFVCPNTQFILGYTEKEILELEHISALIGRGKVPIVDDGKEIRNIELELADKEGKKHTVLMGVKAVNIANNKFLYTFHEITHIKHLEEELRQAQKAEAVGTMAARISHDFNNILSAIAGCVDCALDEAEPGTELYACLSDIKTASKNGAGIVDQLMSFVRRPTTTRSSVSLDDIAREVTNCLGASISKNITVKYEAATEIETIRADSIQINQVVMNLCRNAADAMSKTGGVLTVTVSNSTLDPETAEQHEGVNPGKFVRLQVKDTGCGIDPDLKGKIFDPYFTTKGARKGTGLGLAIVFGIVKEHNGMISVESSPGNGSVFDIYLPVSGAQ